MDAPDSDPLLQDFDCYEEATDEPKKKFLSKEFERRKREVGRHFNMPILISISDFKLASVTRDASTFLKLYRF